MPRQQGQQCYMRLAPDNSRSQCQVAGGTGPPPSDPSAHPRLASDTRDSRRPPLDTMVQGQSGGASGLRAGARCRRLNGHSRHRGWRGRRSRSRSRRLETASYGQEQNDEHTKLAMFHFTPPARPFL